ncbi:hypothetical protein BP6252_01545 [Coleophoma cylindrospora]|uniref:F-box domain-containing protein n=1 Tax=Coleophoma cylindrospora TaxID=1849047 RepID=A0A3D8ST57_9HELO|nr:hypothetical protein BP6252_01545 [Coleophoma cylindrospora]
MASPQSILERLPLDILEWAVALLPLPDICSLRLVSRSLAARSSQRAFRGYFITKAVRWTSVEQMQELVNFTQSGELGCLLQRLTIIGVVPTTGRSDASIALLTEALVNLRLNSTNGCVQSLSLLVRGQDGTDDMLLTIKATGRSPVWRRDWRQVWQAAAQTFEVVCSALAESGLAIQQLDIFSGIHRCSLACDQFAPILDGMDLSKPLQNLISMSLSLSHYVPVIQYDQSLESYGEGGTRSVEDVGRLLALCPQLESLGLAGRIVHGWERSAC